MYRGLFAPAIALASHDSGSPARTEVAEMRKVVAAAEDKNLDRESIVVVVDDDDDAANLGPVVIMDAEKASVVETTTKETTPKP